MPDSLDKDIIKEYQNASLDVLKNFKEIEKSLEIQSRFLKMNGVHHEVIEAVQNEELSTQQKLSAVETNIRSRLNEIYKLHQQISEARRSGLTVNQEDVLQLQQHKQQIKLMSAEYNKLHAERAKSYITDALGFSKLKESTAEYAKMWSKGGPILVGLVVAGSLLKFILEVFNEIDKAAADFRKGMGITREFTKSIDKDARDIHFEFGAVGVTARQVYESVRAIADSFGTTLSSTKDLKVTMSLLSQQLGISAATSAEFLKTMSSVAGTTAAMQENTVLFAAKLSQAAGTNLDEVMKDVANSTKAHYNFMSRSPIAITKAAVEAKRMGTSLNAAASSAEKLVDFTSSIKSEMEASVLIGESINLQRARELAYRKDLKGVNDEILKIAKQAKFEELDPFQQKAVSEALGKSADELGRMLQADREMQKIRRSSDPEIRRQLKAYEDLTRATSKRIADEAKSEKAMLSIKNNSARIESIQTAWKAIVQRIAEVFLPVIDATLGVVADTLSYINLHTGSWGGKIAAVVVAAATLSTIFFGLGKFFTGIGAGLGKGIGSFFQGTANGIKAMGNPNVFKGILAIGLLGLALIPFAGAIKLMEGVSWKTLGIAAVALVGLTAAMFGLGALLSSGVGAVIFGVGLVGLIALGAALIPLGIAALAAGGGLMMLGKGFSAIVSGFKDLQSLSFVGVVSQVVNLTSALKDLAQAMYELPKPEFDKLRDISVGFNAASAGPGAAKIGKSSESDSTLQSILEEISGLRKELVSGGIMASVYLDSQLISSESDRTTRFKNGYGVNTPRVI